MNLPDSTLLLFASHFLQITNSVGLFRAKSNCAAEAFSYKESFEVAAGKKKKKILTLILHRSRVRVRG